MIGLLNVLVFVAGLVALLLISRHYRFFKRAEGHELALRVTLVFLSQIGNIMAILVAKMVDMSGTADFPAVQISVGLIQCFTLVFSCWAAFRLYEIYIKYKDNFPKG